MNRWPTITLQLLEAQSKAEVSRQCDEAVITPDTLSDLLWSARIADDRFVYKRLETERALLHLEPSPSQMQELSKQLDKIKEVESADLALSGAAIGAVRKFLQMPEERRVRIGHFVQSRSEGAWLFLYADQRDVSVSNSHWVESPNHWTEGPHMHVAHGLTTTRTAEQYLVSFMNDMKLPRSVHVRFYDPDWEQAWRDQWSPEARAERRRGRSRVGA